MPAENAGMTQRADMTTTASNPHHLGCGTLSWTTPATELAPSPPRSIGNELRIREIRSPSGQPDGTRPCTSEGRAALKVLMDSDDLELVAVNDVADLANIAYLLRYDTVYGRYHRTVIVGDSELVIDDQRIAASQERDPARLPWGPLAVDLVLERTGVLTTADDLAKHLRAGASYVILSAPAKSDDVPTVVHGVNRPEGQP